MLHLRNIAGEGPGATKVTSVGTVVFTANFELKGPVMLRLSLLAPSVEGSLDVWQKPLTTFQYSVLNKKSLLRPHVGSQVCCCEHDHLELHPETWRFKQATD